MLHQNVPNTKKKVKMSLEGPSPPLKTRLRFRNRPHKNPKTHETFNEKSKRGVNACEGGVWKFWRNRLPGMRRVTKPFYWLLISNKRYMYLTGRWRIRLNVIEKPLERYTHEAYVIWCKFAYILSCVRRLLLPPRLWRKDFWHERNETALLNQIY